MKNQDVLSTVKKLTDLELMAKTKNLAEEERKLTVQLLHHLMVIEERRLYAKRGYQSLHQFMVKDLKYSDGAVYRRIQSMRLMRGVPEVGEKIESGSLSLTNAAQVQRFFREQKVKNSRDAEKRTHAEDSGPSDQKESGSVELKAFTQKSSKLDLIAKLEHKSTREGERVLMELSPEPVVKDRERVLSDTETEVRFTADKGLLDKLNEIKDLLAHQDSSPSYNKLFHKMADLALEKLKKKRGIASARTSQRASAEVPIKSESVMKKPITKRPIIKKPAAKELTKEAQVIKTSLSQKGHSRYIPIRVRKEVWQRDQGKCQFKDPVSGRRCESTYGLEFDHCYPYAYGGDSRPNNIRLLCKVHNLTIAERYFSKTRDKLTSTDG